MPGRKLGLEVSATQQEVDGGRAVAATAIAKGGGCRADMRSVPRFRPMVTSRSPTRFGIISVTLTADVANTKNDER